MNETTFLAMYGHGKAVNVEDKKVLALLEDHPDLLVGEDRQRARDRIAVEPWRLYFPYRPDDMPPKQGNPAALKRLIADPENGYEELP